MLKFKDYFKGLNGKVKVDYEETLLKIRQIDIDSKNYRGEKENYANYFSNLSSFILTLTELEKKLDDKYFANTTFRKLKKDNNMIYEDIIGDNYNKSYGNPKYCVEVFGDEVGQIMTYLYGKVRENIKLVYRHRLFDVAACNQVFIECYEYIFNNEIDVQKLKEIVISDVKVKLDQRCELWMRERFCVEMSYYVDVVTKCDLSDLRYLFRFGEYITDNEVKIAEFFLKLSDEKIEKIASTYTEGFRKGFIKDNKDLSKKSNVTIRYHLGQEIMIKKAIENFREMGLQCAITDKATTNPNKQYEYDHRFDNALYFNEEYANSREISMEKAGERLKDTLNLYSGPAVIETFGEIPFSPKSKLECLKLSEEQSKLFSTHQGNLQKIMSRYMPRDEWSFTIIAFPVPQIGDEFEEIFEETCKVNTLDSDKYERVQQEIIDVLDKAEYVHVKGKDSNKTNIKVRMQKLKNPLKQTNFVNCVADVNIPVGEVFTSPALTGTNGILHVEEVYLKGLKYENLMLTFKHGYVKKYSCTNFDNEEENVKFIEENLMFPHKTLPLGEFAIGTNTNAYVMANKYDIVNILPILIVEKMGPHFAIGDTCFSWSEDLPVYNSLNEKEVTARDNEKSILRKKDISEAYTQVHTDITLPYDGLDFISSITEDGQVLEIIKDGRFVLKGTEELNEPFNE